MDLKLMQAEPSAEERAAVDQLLGPPVSAWDGAVERTSFDHRVARGGAESRDDRHVLLPALHALQSAAGWISPGGMNYVCERLTVPPAEAYGVATFYAMFSTEERPRTVLHVCDDIACRLRGADGLAHDVEGAMEDGSQLVRSPCLGLCDVAPAGLLQAPDGDTQLPAVTLQGLGPLLHGGPWTVHGHTQERSLQPTDELRLLRRVGVVDPSSIDDYRSHGGYEALRLALEHGPEWTIREVTDSKLLGRGGAAFPTGVKWKAVAEQPVRPHYFVCNADESEPGTFKDRVVMEQDPFAVIESVTIAGVTTGCEQGYIYVRGEYPLATERLRNAIEETRRHGFLGDDVMGRGARFDIELDAGDKATAEAALKAAAEKLLANTVIENYRIEVIG